MPRVAWKHIGLVAGGSNLSRAAKGSMFVSSDIRLGNGSSLGCFFLPASIAVIGATDREGSVGGTVFRRTPPCWRWPNIFILIAFRMKTRLHLLPHSTSTSLAQKRDARHTLT